MIDNMSKVLGNGQLTHIKDQVKRQNLEHLAAGLTSNGFLSSSDPEGQHLYATVVPFKSPLSLLMVSTTSGVPI